MADEEDDVPIENVDEGNEEEEFDPPRGLGIYPEGESPYETGGPDRRYGLRNIPIEPDASQFIVWNVFSACVGYFTAYCFGVNGQRSGGLISQISPHFVGFVRRVIDDIRILVSIPVRIFVLIWGWLVFLWGLFTITYDVNIPVIATAIPVPLPIWIVLYLILFYLINAFWPLVYLFVVTVVIPFINVTLLVLSFAFNLLVITLRITFTIYNMNVPFIGIELYFVLTIIFTIMDIVFGLLEAVGIMEIFQAFMEIIFFIIDLNMQIIMVFLQLPMAVLGIMAEVVSYMVKLVMVVVEYCMYILTWIIDYLFRIMEPILFVVQYLASAFSWMMTSSSTAAFTSRKLLELSTGMSRRKAVALGLSGLALSGGTLEEAYTPANQAGLSSPAYLGRSDYVSFTDRIYTQWMDRSTNMNTGNLTESERIESMQSVREFLNEVGETRLDGRNDFQRVRDAYILRQQGGGFGNNMASVSPDAFGRRLLSTRNFQRSAGMSGDAKPSSKKQGGEQEDITMVDRTTEIFMRHFHAGVKNMVQDPYTNMDLMHRSMQVIRDHQRRGTDDYSIMAIMAAYEDEMHLTNRLPKGPAHLRYVNHPDHPAELHNLFTDERRDYANRHGIPETYKEYQESVSHRNRNPGGRKLLEAWTDVHSLHAEHLGRMERDHAKKIAHQARTYKNHHRKRVHTASTLGHGLRKAIYEQGQTVLHPEVLSAHGQAILERFGYGSLKEVYEDYKKEHGSPEQFWLSITDWRNNPFFASFFHSYDRLNEHPHFKSWMDQFAEEEELRKEEKRPAADHFNSKRLAEVLGHDHRLVNGRSHDDNPGGRHLLASKNKLEGLEILASTTCWSSPRNPLCMPDLSWVPFFIPTLISLPDGIDDESNFCDPWQPSTQIWSFRRLLNGWYSILFIFSAFPPLNFFVYGFTLVVPWMAWSVNWFFAVVPGGELASFEDIFCFFIHIYDLILLIVTYAFFRYIVYPIIEELIFRPIQLNILAHNQQYEIQTRALEMAENDPRFERMIRMQTAMLEEQDQVYRRRLARITQNNSTVINQGPETINARIMQVNVGNGRFPSMNPQQHGTFQMFQSHIQGLLENESLSAEEHQRLQRILMYWMHGGTEREVTDYDEIAAEIGRLGLSNESQLRHRLPYKRIDEAV